MSLNFVFWVIIGIIVIAIAGLAFCVGWVIARHDRGSVNLIQLFVGAGFVAVALTIVAVQANLVVSQQNTIKCNTDLIDALKQRNEAGVAINQEGIHFHKHMLLWLTAQSEEPQDIKATKETEAQLRDSLEKLIDARNRAIVVESGNPLPNCR
jgi:hypothetical protein